MTREFLLQVKVQAHFLTRINIPANSKLRGKYPSDYNKIRPNIENGQVKPRRTLSVTLTTELALHCLGYQVSFHLVGSDLS